MQQMCEVVEDVAWSSPELLLTDVGDGVDLVLLALQLAVVVVCLALRREVPVRHMGDSTTRSAQVGCWAQRSFGLGLVWAHEIHASPMNFLVGSDSELFIWKRQRTLYCCYQGAFDKSSELGVSGKHVF